MKKKRVLVIGAGMGGLSAAIRLQHAGYQVEIFEKEAMPGGKMYQLREQGFTFDVGPTLVMMPSVYQELFSMTGRNPDDYIPMTRLDPMYDVYFKASPMRHYVVKNDLVSLLHMAESKGIENSLGFLSYLSEMYKRFQVAMRSFITRSFRSKSDIYNLHMLKEALKLKTFDSAEKMMASFIPDKDLQQMFSFQTLYIGVSPQKGPSLYNIIPLIELLYGVWFIRGGMHTMAQQCVKLFEELGGVIHYNKTVERVVIEEGRARGLLVEGQTIEGDSIVCNADFPYAMKELIQDSKARGKYSPEHIDSMEYSCSCLVFYWGVDIDPQDLPVHSFVISSDLEDNLNSIFDGRVIADPSVYLHIPSKIDASMAPENCSSFYVLLPVSDLITSRYDWDELTVQNYRTKILSTLSQLPGLSDLEKHILVEKIFTPKDFEERFHAYRGSTFGLQPTLKQSNHWRPQPKSMTCEGLYFAGSSIHPGAGVPIVIESGRLCAEEIKRDDGEASSL